MSSMRFKERQAEPKSYPLIDALKFVFAIGIIAIHTGPLKDFSIFADDIVVQCFTRVGVPFFFVAAGYFLFGKMNILNIDLKRIEKYVLRIFKMLVVWTLIYMPIIIWNVVMHSKNGFMGGMLNKIYSFITAGDAQMHLWFLHALIIAVLLIAMFIKLGWRIKRILFLAGILHMIALLGGSYYFVYILIFPEESAAYEMLHEIGMWFGGSRNGFTIGFLYVAMGAYLGLIKKSWSKRLIYNGIVISWILLIFEVLILLLFEAGKGDVYIFLFPLTMFIFLMGINSDCKINQYITMRKMSMYIYFVHPWFIAIISMFSKKVFPLGSLSKFIIITFLTLAMSWIIVTHQYKKKKIQHYM